MPRKCLCLYSGGLDSRLVIKLMVEMGIEVVAFHGLHSFESKQTLREIEDEVRRECLELGASEVICKDMTADILKLVKENKYGLGKNLNPCTDCRINTIILGYEVMKEVGAEFICSGEVVGQRPKSQQRHSMNCILNRLKEAGGDGLLLRPLSAKLLDPTVPEKKGWVDREELLDLSGRSRYDQMALADELGIKNYPAPAGGCLLTDIGFSARLDELFNYCSNVDNNEVDLLKFGRHYRADNGAKIVSARNGEEGDIIESLARNGDTFYITSDRPGAFVMVRGEVNPETERIAAGLSVYYSRYRTEGKAGVLKYNCNTAIADAELLAEVEVVNPEEISGLIIDREKYLLKKKERDARYQHKR